MARSTWKGPFVDPKLLKKVRHHFQNKLESTIQTWSRRSTIIPMFVGMTFSVHNGKKFTPVHVSEDMIGHKLGEFSPTRVMPSHSPSSTKRKGKK